MSSSPLEAADVWSKAGLVVGSTAVIALVTADGVMGGAKFSISQPLHGLAILIIAIVMDTCVTIQVGVRLSYRQERFAREIKTEIKDEIKTLVRESYGNGYVDGLAKRGPALQLIQGGKPDEAS